MTVVVAEEAKKIARTCLADENGVEVLRVKAGDQFGVNFVKKGITILKIEPLLIRAIKQYLFARSYDVVLYATPPVTFANVIKFCKKRYGCKSYLMLKDIFPQNAVDMGIIKENSLLHRFFQKKEKNLYCLSDHIGCMSPANINYVKEHNQYINKEKLELFPNTVKVLPAPPISEDYEIRKRLGIPPDKTVFVFGGNIGIPQGIDYLINCIEKMTNYSEAFFLIVGDGTERDRIKQRINTQGLDNVLLLNRLPKADYDKLMLECDVGLVLLDKRFTIPNYPSRTLAYMHIGLPILAATDKVSDIKELLNEAGCGLWTYSGDEEAFINEVKYLCENIDLRKQMGQNGRRYLEGNFDVSRSVKILEGHFGIPS